MKQAQPTFLIYTFPASCYFSSFRCVSVANRRQWYVIPAPFGVLAIKIFYNFCCSILYIHLPYCQNNIRYITILYSQMYVIHNNTHCIKTIVIILYSCQSSASNAYPPPFQHESKYITNTCG